MTAAGSVRRRWVRLTTRCSTMSRCAPPPQIIAAFLHSAVYCGFPACSTPHRAERSWPERGLLSLDNGGHHHQAPMRLACVASGQWTPIGVVALRTSRRTTSANVVGSRPRRTCVPLREPNSPFLPYSAHISAYSSFC